jgi:hypothetical protein
LRRAGGRAAISATAPGQGELDAVVGPTPAAGDAGQGGKTEIRG